MTGIPSRMMKGLTVGSLWMYILAVLSRKPSYPYEVRKLIKKYFGFEPPIVTLYTTFYRLEREGFIRKEEGLYRVSERGQEILVETVRLLRELARKIETVSSAPTRGDGVQDS